VMDFLGTLCPLGRASFKVHSPSEPDFDSPLPPSKVALPRRGARSTFHGFIRPDANYLRHNAQVRLLAVYNSVQPGKLIQSRVRGKS